MNKDNLNSVRFTGNGFEYFKLCLANFFLSVITLGIFSAWATVRNKQYLYGHTSADDHAFQYHAKPIQVLKGRLIAIALLVIYIFINSISPAIGTLLALILLGFIPLIIARSIRFKFRMTSYRNVRFNFSGNANQAFLVFILYPFLSLFTLYLIFPLILKKQNEYVFGNIQYASEQFSTELKTSVFFKVSAIVLGVSVVLIAAPIAFIFLSGVLSGATMNPFLIFLAYIPILFASAINMAIYQALIWKHITQNTTLSKLVKFNSNLTIVGLLKLYAVNFLMVVFTLGIATPWVAIRNQRYFCEHTQVAMTPAIESVISKKVEEDSALGDETANAFDLDAGSSFI